MAVMGAVEFVVRIELQTGDGGVISAVWMFLDVNIVVELIIGLLRGVVCQSHSEMSCARKRVVTSRIVM